MNDAADETADGGPSHRPITRPLEAEGAAEQMAAGSHGSSDTPGAASSAAPPGPVALIELLDRDSRIRQAVPVARWPLAIGRAIDNDVVLEDPHVAPYHAVIEASAEGRMQLRVLPGRNGMRSGRRLLPAGETVALETLAASGSGPIELSAGLTRLRLRRAGEALDPERALPAAGPGHAGTLVLALLLWMCLLAQHAVGLDPGSKASDWLPPLVGAPLALAGWCLLWGLASKLFQHRFEFWPHLAVAVRGVLIVEVLTFVLPWLSALTGWAGFVRIVTGAGAAVGVATLWAHARLVLPQQARALAVAAAAAYLVSTAILMSLNQQRNERWFAELYVHILPPPALMWQKPVARDAFVKRAERLRPALDKATADSADEQKDRGDADDEE